MSCRRGLGAGTPGRGGCWCCSAVVAFIRGVLLLLALLLGAQTKGVFGIRCFSYKHVRDSALVGVGKMYSRVLQCKEGITSCLTFRGSYTMPDYYLDMPREFVDGGCGPFGRKEDLELITNLRDIPGVEAEIGPEEVVNTTFFGRCGHRMMNCAAYNPMEKKTYWVTISRKLSRYPYNNDPSRLPSEDVVLGNGCQDTEEITSVCYENREKVPSETVIEWLDCQVPYKAYICFSDLCNFAAPRAGEPGRVRAWSTAVVVVFALELLLPCGAYW